MIIKYRYENWEMSAPVECQKTITEAVRQEVKTSDEGLERLTKLTGALIEFLVESEVMSPAQATEIITDGKGQLMTWGYNFDGEKPQDKEE